VLSIFAGIWLASEMHIVTAQAYNAYYKGFDGFNEKTYENSELFGWLKENKLEGKLYSNSFMFSLYLDFYRIGTSSV
jgi:hypothetical protein